MSDLYYTPWHEWVRLEDGAAAVGLTGVGVTGDVVYIELPDIGCSLDKGDVCASVETVKTISEVHSPLNGIVTAVNDDVFDDPDLISRKPLDTWLFKLNVPGADPQGLLTEQEYAEIKQTK